MAKRDIKLLASVVWNVGNIPYPVSFLKEDGTEVNTFELIRNYDRINGVNFYINYLPLLGKTLFPVVIMNTDPDISVVRYLDASYLKNIAINSPDVNSIYAATNNYISSTFRGVNELNGLPKITPQMIPNLVAGVKFNNYNSIGYAKQQLATIYKNSMAKKEQPKPTPAVEQPKPMEQSKSEPVEEQPKPETAQKPKPEVQKPEPMVEQPKPEPVVEQPKAEPVIEQPKPVQEQPKAEPVMEQTKSKAVVGQVDSAEESKEYTFTYQPKKLREILDLRSSLDRVVTKVLEDNKDWVLELNKIVDGLDSDYDNVRLIYSDEDECLSYLEVLRKIIKEMNKPKEVANHLVEYFLMVGRYNDHTVELFEKSLTSALFGTKETVMNLREDYINTLSMVRDIKKDNQETEEDNSEEIIEDEPKENNVPYEGAISAVPIKDNKEETSTSQTLTWNTGENEKPEDKVEHTNQANDTNRDEVEQPSKVEPANNTNVAEQSGNSEVITFIREKYNEEDVQSVGSSGVSLKTALEMLNNKDIEIKIPYVTISNNSMLGTNDIGIVYALIQELTSTTFAVAGNYPKSVVLNYAKKLASFLGIEKTPFDFPKYIQEIHGAFGKEAASIILNMTRINIHKADEYDLYEGLPLHIYLLYSYLKISGKLNSENSVTASKLIDIAISSIDNSITELDDENVDYLDTDDDDKDEEISEDHIIYNTIELNSNRVWREALDNIVDKYNGKKIKGLAALQYVYSNKNNLTVATSPIIQSAIKTNFIRFKLYQVPMLFDMTNSELNANIASCAINEVYKGVANYYSLENKGNTSKEELKSRIENYLKNDVGNVVKINEISQKSNTLSINIYCDYNYILEFLKNKINTKSLVDFTKIVPDINNLNKTGTLETLDYNVLKILALRLSTDAGFKKDSIIPVGYEARIENPDYKGDRIKFLPMYLAGNSSKYIKITNPGGVIKTVGYLNKNKDSELKTIIVKTASVEQLNKYVSVDIVKALNSEEGKENIMNIIINNLKMVNPKFELPRSLQIDYKILNKLLANYLAKKIKDLL